MRKKRDQRNRNASQNVSRIFLAYLFKNTTEKWVLKSGARQIGNEKCARTFLHKFENVEYFQVRDMPAKFAGHPSSKPKEEKLSRAGTNFSATTPSRGRPSSHREVSGPKKYHRNGNYHLKNSENYFSGPAI